MMARCLLIALLFIAPFAQAETWHFGLIGDVPYSHYERRELPLMLEAIGESKPTAILHVGDIKNSNDPCTESLLLDRYRLFSSSPAPFVYIAGDNEWSDCDRVITGNHSQEEELARLRRIFWKDNKALGPGNFLLEQQSPEYPEHARFRIGPVLFITLNLPGGDNNYGNTGTPSKEFSTRNPHVLAWLKAGFAKARQEKLSGVVVLFQANPGFRHFSQGLGHAGFRDFLTVLRDEVEAFPGPVVAVHGDTHTSRIDHPMRDRKGKIIARFTRVETFGYPLMGWTNGVIDTDHPALFRFTAHPWKRGDKLL